MTKKKKGLNQHELIAVNKPFPRYLISARHPVKTVKDKSAFFLSSQGYKLTRIYV